MFWGVFACLCSQLPQKLCPDHHDILNVGRVYSKEKNEYILGNLGKIQIIFLNF